MKHLIDLLEGEALGLGHEQVSVNEAAGAERAPDVKDFGAEVALVGVGHIGGDDGDDAVPHPVGGGGEGDALCAHGEGEDLADDDPGAGPPGGGEEEDVDADEGDHGLDGAVVVGPDGAHDGDDELADDHAGRPPDQEGAAAEALHGVEGDRGGADVDEGGDEVHEEGVADGAELLEEGGAEVEDEVAARELLHHLEGDAEEGTAGVAVGLEDGTLEAHGPGTEVAGVGYDAGLVFVVGDDLGELVADVVGVDGLVAEPGEVGGGPLELSFLDEVTGRLWEEEETNGQDQGPGELKSDGDAVRAAVLAVLGAVVDARGKEKTDCDAELVSRDQGAADLAGSNLGHVQDDDGRDETDAEAGNKSTSNDEAETRRGSLERDTDHEDGTAANDGKSASDPVGQVTGDESAKEGTSREDGSDERLFPDSEGDGVGAIDNVDEVIHTQNARDITRVVAEENTAEGAKDAHQVRPDGDRGFDAVNVDGPHRGRCSSWHRVCCVCLLVCGVV